MIEQLIKLATHLDRKGYSKEADYLDAVIEKGASALLADSIPPPDPNRDPVQEVRNDFGNMRQTIHKLQRELKSLEYSITHLKAYNRNRQPAPSEPEKGLA